MTTAIINASTPDAIKGCYVVARYWNSVAHDFLSDWDAEHGAAFTGIDKAMPFDDKTEAVRAAIKAKRLVPATIDGGQLFYDVMIAA